jgi:hypothetical protein
MSHAIMSTFPPIDGPGCNWETIVASRFLGSPAILDYATYDECAHPRESWVRLKNHHVYSCQLLLWLKMVGNQDRGNFLSGIILDIFREFPSMFAMRGLTPPESLLDSCDDVMALAQAQLGRISSGLCVHDVSPLATRFIQ